ncbi:hypothetical protein [Lactiplantibacillus plantarum]|uniref:hypothetical protein n=1 Tax=Lactiplantibacillus plantarum TaxID=1590 RepID=UPI00280B2E0A|nr:hypothetical protein [Lactiplantibacillus plantarum]
MNELQNLASTKKTTQVHRQASKQEINFRVSEPDYLKLARSAQTQICPCRLLSKKKAQGRA